MESYIDNDLNIADISYIYEVYRDKPWYFSNPGNSANNLENSTMYTLRMNLLGSIAVSYGKNELLMKSPSITFAKADQAFSKSRGIDLPTRNISINFFTEKKIMLLENSGEPINIYPENPEKFSALFEKALEIFSSNPLDSKLEQKGIILQIISLVKSEYLSKFMDKTLPKGFIEVIKKAEVKALESENIDIKKLAKECNLSYEYFIRIFKKHMGISPKQYFNKIKLDYCASMLRYSHFSVEDITGITGYTNLPYFFRSFKKQFGISPMRYRQLHTKQ